MSNHYSCEARQDTDEQLRNAREGHEISDFDTMVEKEFKSLPLVDNVINLSDYPLTESQKEILNKGLKFCPTPGEPQMGDLRKDLDKYHRSLCTQESKEMVPSTGPYSDTCSLKLKSKSKWSPPMGPTNLETVISINELGLLDLEIPRPKNHNITRSQKSSISDLLSNRNIVIKPADKGGATVIQNRSDYITEGERQLKDENFYKLTDEDLTVKHNNMIADQLEAMRLRGEITQKVKDFLIIDEPRTPELYLLPKIHKGTYPVPGRPIVSANESHTERISAFVDHFIAPIVKQGRSYVRDTGDFLQKIGGIESLTGNEILATLDVSSLYTNIPNDEGCEATYQALLKNRDLEINPSNLSIIEKLSQVLTYNNFKFNGRHYLQIVGTAMGTKLAPSYANIFMSDFEDKHVYTYRLQPLLWLRYIDDVFCIWQHGKEELEDFIKHLNNVHRSIKFTGEKSCTSINFLDTTVELWNKRLTTTLYVKPTDRNNYLPFDSAHPYHCKKGLPYGQFLRIRRICSLESDFQKHCVRKAALLRQKGYPLSLLTDAYKRAKSKDQKELLRPNNKENKSGDKCEMIIFLTTTYSPDFGGLKHQVESTWDLLDRASTTRSLHNKGLTVGYRRPKNLRDILVRARLPSEVALGHGEDKHREDKTCKSKNCRYCPLLNKSGKIVANSTARKYRTRHNVTCNSNNLTYCITCKRCGKQYVGQTKNSLKERFKSHFYQIAHDREKTEVSRHFNQGTHEKLKDVEIHILEFVHASTEHDNTKDKRTQLEFDWIHRMRSQIPKGLNSIDSLY